MKRLPVFVLACLASVALQAHATSSPDSVVDTINSVVHSNSIGGNDGSGIGGGGGGNGDPIGGICTSSPENPTVVLAALSGAGLFLGRRLRRSRPVQAPAA